MTNALLMQDLLHGSGVMTVYFIVCAGGALLLRSLVNVPKELFRKILHLILVGAVVVWYGVFPSWWLAMAATVLFVIVVYPLLRIGEHLPRYAEMLVERKPGEVRRSLLTVSGMLIILCGVCWGLLNEKYLLIASVLAWGLGDAAAALVGKRFGRHYIEGKHVEGRKTWEGTLAMFITAFIAVLAVLLITRTIVWYGYVPTALLTAAVCAVVELFTKNGQDTLTCPLAAAAVLIPLVRLLGV